MNPNCLYAEPGDWTRVAAVQGEAANHYTIVTNDTHGLFHCTDSNPFIIV